METAIHKKEYSWKQFFISLLVIAACLFLFALFPAKGFVQDLTKSLVFLVIAPILYIKIILKRGLSQFGLNLQNKKDGLIWAGIMLVALLATFYILIQTTSFKKEYVLPGGISSSFWFFLFYELVLLNILLFLQEFFFKGFVLSVFEEKIAYWSILAQAAIAVVPLLFLHKSYWSISPMIATSLLGGLVAWKSRSFIYSYASGLLFTILLDAYLIHLVKFK